MSDPGEKCFYVWLADDSICGPLFWRDVRGCDKSAWLRLEGEEGFWPRKCWNEHGERAVSLWEHYRAWVWMLALAPAGVFFLKPDWLIPELGVLWLVAFVFAFLGMLISPSPRFPKA